MAAARLFVRQCLERLSKEAAGKKFSRIRDTCSDCLNDLNSVADDAPLQLPRGMGVADRYFSPFQLACETKVPKIVELSLESVLGMVSNGYLIGNYIIKRPSGEEGIFADVVVKTVCSCFDVHSEAVEMLIIKILLSGVASCFFHVHGSSLLYAVRTCYNIHLVSKYMVNQVTAKAAIAQILSIICQRFEISKVDSMLLSKGEEFVEDWQSRERVASMAPEARDQEYVKTFVSNIMSRVIAREELAQAAKIAQREKPRVLSPASSVHSHSFSSPGTSTASPRTPRMMSSPKLEREHSEDNGNGSPATGPDVPPPVQIDAPEDTSSSIFASIHEKDIFLIFRALCKLSMKVIPDEAPPDSVDMRSRVLALEFLLLILDHAGPSLRSNDRFILAIKQYLCMSVLKNAVTAIPALLRLAATIFLVLISSYAENLKNELTVFFNNIFFRALESPHSSFHQKMIVLQVFLKICVNPQMLVDLYVNYDCELTEDNIFERFVSLISQLYQNPSVGLDEEGDAERLEVYHSAVRTLSFECVSAAMRSMSTWMDDKLKNQDAQEKGHNHENSDVTASTTMTASSEEVDQITHDKEDDQPATPTSRTSDQFERQRQQKLEMLEGVKRFNEKPKRGIEYLSDTGMIDRNSPESVARFLRQTPGLDKTKAGEYLGEGDDFNVRVLYHYVDSMSFGSMLFDEALRFFLSGFRLPGEAQKIDRMMEKFAERFCKDNPTLFASADTAYVLAYSTIMLQTDAHNPMVKNKMSKEAFIGNNRGINDGKDLDRAFLESLYDRIVAQAITLDEDRKLAVELASDKKSRQRILREETERIVQQSHAMLSRSRAGPAKYYSSARAEHVRSMFEVSCKDLHVPIAAVLEQSAEERLVDLALEAARLGVHISCTFLLEAERGAFVQLLARNTLLGTIGTSGTSLMRRRNLECVRLIMDIALSEGNQLQAAWRDVLCCLSRIERLGQVLDPSGIDLRGPPASQADESNAQVLFSFMPNLHSQIDRIFQRSAALSSDAVVYFAEALCGVSREEIPNRMFSLQRMVEVADFNMTRVRIVWSQLWTIFAEHFTAVGCHQNRLIAMYAIDSLRQLAVKFLAKDELVNYSFQRDFLKPFEDIIRDAKSPEIRELVVRCVGQMVAARGQSIRSGWRMIFQVLDRAASDTLRPIVELAFGTITDIVERHFLLIVDSFVDCVKAIVSLAKNLAAPDALSIRAIELLVVCINQLLAGVVPGVPASSTQTAEQESQFIYTDSQQHLHVWFPVLTGLSFLLLDRRATIRKRASDALFDRLQVVGHYFSNSLWKLVFSGVVFPIFADLQDDEGAITVRKDTEWIRTTCGSCLMATVDLFGAFFPRLASLLPEVARLIETCICVVNLTLVRAGCDALIRLVVVTASDADIQTHDTLVQLFDRVCERSMPSLYASRWPSSEDLEEQATTPSNTLQVPNSNVAISKSSSSTSVSSNSSAVPRRTASFSSLSTPRSDVWEIQCASQMELMRVADNFVVSAGAKISALHLKTVFSAVHKVYTAAHAFNANPVVRKHLFDQGCSDLLRLMLSLEARTAETYLGVLAAMFCGAQGDIQKRKRVAEAALFAGCDAFLRNYLALIGKPADHPSAFAVAGGRVSPHGRDRSASTAAPPLHLVGQGESPEKQNGGHHTSSSGNVVSPLVVAGMPLELQHAVAQVPIVLGVLAVFQQLEDKDFRLEVRTFFPLWTSLIEAPHAEIRAALKSVFSRVSRLYSL